MVQARNVRAANSEGTTMATIQLSDTQSVILATACAREGGLALPITASLKGAAVDMVLLCPAGHNSTYALNNIM